MGPQSALGHPSYRKYMPQRKRHILRSGGGRTGFDAVAKQYFYSLFARFWVRMAPRPIPNAIKFPTRRGTMFRSNQLHWLDETQHRDHHSRNSPLDRRRITTARL